MTAATDLERRSCSGTVYHVGGAGEPVLLLHGLGGGSANWCELVPELVRRHRVVAVDLPGHAGSAPLPRRATVEDFAAAAAAVLDAEEVESALVVGHSFGGLVALWLAHRRPELVRGLLLVSPAGISTARRLIEALVVATTTIKPGRTVARFHHRWADRAWYRRALLRPWFVADADALGERATHGLLEAHARHANTLIAGRAMVAGDLRRELDVRCPALVLWGARDAQLPVDDAFEYARRLRAPLRVVADCGHLVIVERPRAVLDALAALAKPS